MHFERLLLTSKYVSTQLQGRENNPCPTKRSRILGKILWSLLTIKHFLVRGVPRHFVAVRAKWVKWERHNETVARSTVTIRSYSQKSTRKAEFLQRPTDRPGWIKQTETKPNETKPNETKPNETKPNQTKKVHEFTSSDMNFSFLLYCKETTATTTTTCNNNK